MEPAAAELHEVFMASSLVAAQATPTAGDFAGLEIDLPLSPLTPLDWELFSETAGTASQCAEHRSPGDLSTSSCASSSSPSQTRRVQAILPAPVAQAPVMQSGPAPLQPLPQPLSFPPACSSPAAAMRPALATDEPSRRENKAQREKLRRNDLNERFNQLGAMLGVRADKVSVLEHSMSTIASLRKQNSDLKADADKVRAENAALVALLRRVLPNGQVSCEAAAPGPVMAPPVPHGAKPAPFYPPLGPTSFGLAPMPVPPLHILPPEEPVLHAPVA